MRIFISHSSRDSRVAELLIDLLLLALNLRSEDIRCTSVEGYRLPGGVSTDEALRREVHDAQLFIGLITPDSIHSAYVLFELGARWGAEKTLIPLLASGASSEHLRGPLSGMNALNCSVADQVHQLVEEVAKHLSVDPGRPSTYQKALTALVTASSAAPVAGSDTASPDPQPKSRMDPSDAKLQLLSALAGGSADRDGELNLKDIGSLLGFSVSVVNLLVDDLKEDGLVAHITGSSDHIGLTLDGVT